MEKKQWVGDGRFTLSTPERLVYAVHHVKKEQTENVETPALEALEHLVWITVIKTWCTYVIFFVFSLREPYLS